jgi:hypothetical protein
MGRGEVLAGKPEGKRPVGRRRPKWEDNIKMDLQEVGCGGVDWVDLAQERDSWRANKHSDSLKFGEFLD